MIKKIEYEEIKEWLLEYHENKDEITDEFIKKKKGDYFDFIYGDSPVYRKYNKDGTFELVRDNTYDDWDDDRHAQKKKKYSKRRVKFKKIQL